MAGIPNKNDFQIVNSILSTVLNRAIFFMTAHDRQFKKYCLQMSAWEGIQELKTAVADLTSPIQEVVVIAIEGAGKTPETVFMERYPVAEEVIIKLVDDIEMLGEEFPEIKEGIDKKELARALVFSNLKKVASEI